MICCSVFMISRINQYAAFNNSLRTQMSQWTMRFLAILITYIDYDQLHMTERVVWCLVHKLISEMPNVLKLRLQQIIYKNECVSVSVPMYVCMCVCVRVSLSDCLSHSLSLSLCQSLSLPLSPSLSLSQPLSLTPSVSLHLSIYLLISEIDIFVRKGHNFETIRKYTSTSYSPTYHTMTI